MMMMADKRLNLRVP